MFSLLLLYNLHASIAVPVAVSRVRAGYNTCVICDLQIPEWNNHDGTHRDLAWIKLLSENTVLLFDASARNGQWHGALVLERHGSKGVSRQSLRGQFTAASGVAMDQAINDGSGLVPVTGMLEITPEYLIESGVPQKELGETH